MVELNKNVSRRAQVDDVKIIFAQNLAQLRKQAKLTQIEFAEKINYSDKAVSKWERGESIPDVAVLKNIANFFGVTVDFLITERPANAPIEEKTNYVKAVNNKNRFFIAAITLCAVLVCSVIVFVALQSAYPDDFWTNFQTCIIFPLPIYSILLIIFTSLWSKKKVWKIFSVSLLVWSVLLVAFCIAFIATANAYWLVFAIGVPAQIIILMSYGIIQNPVKKLKKQEKTEDTNQEIDK